MKQFGKWLTRIIFTYRWPDSGVTEDKAQECYTIEDWFNTINYYIDYTNLNCLKVIKVRGLLAKVTYSLMKRRKQK